MKLSTLATLISVSLILILSGCVSKPKPASLENLVTDSSLPKIILTQHGVKTGMKSVALEWKLINDKRVKGIYLYKVALDVNNTNEDEYLDTIQNRFSTHYIDTGLKAGSRYKYYFKTYSKTSEGLKSESFIVTTQPVLNAVTWIHAARDMPKSAKIIWRPHTNKLVYAYQIERRTLDEKEWSIIATLEGRLRAEFIDIELKNKHTYLYRIRVLTYNKLVSTPSREVTVITKALPKEVTGIKATDDKPKEIVVTWDKTNISDFLKYNVYRSSKIDGGYKLIAEISKNSFTDKIEEDGVNYFYRISTIDKDMLESKYIVNSAKGVTLVKPKTPTMVEAKIVENNIIIKWSKADDRTVSYVVTKRSKKGMFDEVFEEFDGIMNTSFHDAKIEPATKYFYKVYSVDKNQIRSTESIEIELEAPKAIIK